MKKMLSAIAVATATLMFSLNAYAGQWNFVGPENWQWTYTKDDGTMPRSTFETIDGKIYHFDDNAFLDTGLRTFDGGATFYLFDENTGAALANETFDHGYADENGILHFNGIGQNFNDRHIHEDVCNSDGSFSNETRELPEWKYKIMEDVFDHARNANAGTFTLTYQIPRELNDIERLALAFNITDIFRNRVFVGNSNYLKGGSWSINDNIFVFNGEFASIY